MAVQFTSNMIMQLQYITHNHILILTVMLVKKKLMKIGMIIFCTIRISHCGHFCQIYCPYNLQSFPQLSSYSQILPLPFWQSSLLCNCRYWQKTTLSNIFTGPGRTTIHRCSNCHNWLMDPKFQTFYPWSAPLQTGLYLEIANRKRFCRIEKKNYTLNWLITKWGKT